MGIKITELPPIVQIKNTDELPTSQLELDNTRTTYKLTTDQLKTFINQQPNQRIDDLALLINGFNSFDPNILNKYLPLSGGTMTGNIDLSGNKMNRFSANIINLTNNTTLDQTHNGSIICVNKAASLNPDDRVEITVSNSLLNGFNALIIQTGDMQVKVIKSDIGITLANPDNALSTRRKYSQINLCKLDSNLFWITGDMV